MAEYTISRTLDCMSIPCPMPVVRISQEIGKVSVGQVIEVHTTDPGSLSDFPAWAKTAGHSVLDMKQGPGVIRIFVKRLK